MNKCLKSKNKEVVADATMTLGSLTDNADDECFVAVTRKNDTIKLLSFQLTKALKTDLVLLQSTLRVLTNFLSS